MLRLCIPMCSRWRISLALPQVGHVACLPRSASPWCLPREAQTALSSKRCASKTCQVARHLIGHTARKSSEVAWLALACAEEGPTRLVQLGGKRSSSLWRGTSCPNLTDGIGTEATGIQRERMCAKTTAAKKSDIIVIIDAFSLCDRFLIQGSCSRLRSDGYWFRAAGRRTWRACRSLSPAKHRLPIWTRARFSQPPTLWTFRPLARGHTHFSKSYFLIRVRANV